MYVFVTQSVFKTVSLLASHSSFITKLVILHKCDKYSKNITKDVGANRSKVKVRMEQSLENVVNPNSHHHSNQDDDVMTKGKTLFDFGDNKSNVKVTFYFCCSRDGERYSSDRTVLFVSTSY